MNTNEIFLYMSRWGNHGGVPGLALFAFDTATGAIRLVKLLNETVSFGPSVIDRERRILYLCNEDDLTAETGYATGRVYGYRIQPDTGGLTELFRRDTYCPYPDYLGFSADRRWLLVPHHSDARSVTTIQQDAFGRFVPVVRHMDSAVELFALNGEGIIDRLADVRKHTLPHGTTDYQGELTVPHPHCAVLSPSGKLFAVCDKGDGCVYLYAVDEENQTLRCLSRTPGEAPLSEPRYCAFHPTRPYLFVNYEHTAHGRMPVSAFRYDEEGTLTHINTVDCLPADQPGPGVGQGFCLSPDGSRLYDQVAGANLMAVLAVDAATGRLAVRQQIPIPGAKPRCCALSPDGRFLVAACMSGEIVVYSVGPDGGLTLTPHGAFLKGSAYMTFYQP